MIQLTINFGSFDNLHTANAGARINSAVMERIKYDDLHSGAGALSGALSDVNEFKNNRDGVVTDK